MAPAGRGPLAARAGQVMARALRRRVVAFPVADLALAALVLAAPAPATATAPYQPQAPVLATPWTGQVSSTDPWPQYPRPQLERSSWLNLNGRWQYQVRDGAFRHPDADEPVLVFAVTPAKVLAFGKGAFSHTRHRF